MTATAQPQAAAPATCPLDVAAAKADRAIELVRAGNGQRAMLAIVEGRARLRRSGLAECPSSQEVRRRLRAAEAAVDGLEVDDNYNICDSTGRRWRPATARDTVDGGEVYVPEYLAAAERYAPESPSDDYDDEAGADEDYDIGPLGILPVNGHAPDDRGDVCAEGINGTYWFPFASCYLPE